ncbi:hypothetical protein JL721_1894 [Aureococcus anophagefferens]|nr:hypothetical protein JL721_1894 [Aureococcus anophagefferens]
MPAPLDRCSFVAPAPPPARGGDPAPPRRARRRRTARRRRGARGGAHGAGPRRRAPRDDGRAPGKTLASLASSASATRSAVAAFERGDVADGAAAARAAEATALRRGDGAPRAVAEARRARRRGARRRRGAGPGAVRRGARGGRRHRDAPLVFVAGLEGTGHHWYKSLFEQCGRRCRPSLARRTPRRGGRGPGATTWILNALGGRNDDAMAALKKRAPLAWTEGEGMASYPPRRATVFFSAERRFAELLRVSLATRDAAAIVRSVCDKRNFAKSVRGRRRRPPPPLALCDHFAFEDLAKGDAAALARLGPFLGLDDAGALARRVKAPHTPSAPGPKDAKGQRDRATLVAQLAAAQDSAVAACARQRRRA